VSGQSTSLGWGGYLTTVEKGYYIKVVKFDHFKPKLGVCLRL
jgi:hypothetical protein